MYFSSLRRTSNCRGPASAAVGSAVLAVLAVAAGAADDEGAARFAACLARLALISSSAVSRRLAYHVECLVVRSGPRTRYHTGPYYLLLTESSSPASASASAVRFAAAVVEAGGA